MKLIDIHEAVREAETRIAQALAARGQEYSPVVLDEVMIAIMSTIVDEVNARLAALAGWEA